MKILVVIVLFLFIPQAYAQDYSNILRVAFYNLENLFDIHDDPEIRDEEYTPEGDRYWSEFRYREKSNNMSKAILGIGGWNSAPAIIGVAEVENAAVLQDLINRPALIKSGYNIIHYSSPDRRGIDVGLLYREDYFSPFYSKNIRLRMPDDSTFRSRDLLYVKGISSSLDTLHLIVCHWPSRYGGQQRSEPKRIQAALTVKELTDSILGVKISSNIIIMGDFNDEWKDKSLSYSLGALPKFSNKPGQLINLMADLPVNEGSHKYQGVWSYLDQIIVSSSLLDGLAPDVSGGTAKVVREEFLLETDEKYPGAKPRRTFSGLRYTGGFSDHLPVYIDVVGSGSEGK